MPVISVVIPAFNAERTIGETLASVLNQTFTDFEVIVIDDGSQDSTLAIVQSITDSHLQVFSYPNAGVAASRNRGIFQAVGDFVAFLDADDLWTADKLSDQLQALQTHPEATIAYSWTDYIDETGQFLRPGMHVTANGNVHSRLLLSFFLENGSNFLIKREALLRVGGFDESLIGSEDWDLALRLSVQDAFVAVPRPQVLYRIDGHAKNSISSNLERQKLQCLKVIEKAFAQAPTSLQSLKPQSIANIYKYLMYKALAGTPNRQDGWLAAQYFYQLLIYNPAIVQQLRLMISTLLKIATALIFGKWRVQKTSEHVSTKVIPTA